MKQCEMARLQLYVVTRAYHQKSFHFIKIPEYNSIPEPMQAKAAQQG
jgi:hypothetical protein